MPKKRLDQLLVDRGLVETREKAKSLILAKKVLINESSDLKPGQLVKTDAEVRLLGPAHPYVSRGGVKLAGALDHFKIEVSGRIGLDIGASTGGFTDVLLCREIAQVFAVDVGHSQLDWKIRSNPRVKVLEKLNARRLRFEDIGSHVDIIVVDVSFISLDKILPPLVPLAHSQTDWVTLIKPQFELQPAKIGKGGIVRSDVDRLSAAHRIMSFGKTLGLMPQGLVESVIAGTTGNKEFFVHWKKV